MVGSSKILTVSYGTFSCTLEGFDDPFSTMRSIAEYFRDLAADDRYFGAEPPTPDAEMLHKIAQREVQRRVEAQVSDTGIVLRQSGQEAADKTPARLSSGSETAPARPFAAHADVAPVDKLDRIRAVVERARSRPAAAPAWRAPSERIRSAEADGENTEDHGWDADEVVAFDDLAAGDLAGHVPASDDGLTTDTADAPATPVETGSEAGDRDDDRGSEDMAAPLMSGIADLAARKEASGDDDEVARDADAGAPAEHLGAAPEDDASGDAPDLPEPARSAPDEDTGRIVTRIESGRAPAADDLTGDTADDADTAGDSDDAGDPDEDLAERIIRLSRAGDQSRLLSDDDDDNAGTDGPTMDPGLRRPLDAGTPTQDAERKEKRRSVLIGRDPDREPAFKRILEETNSKMADREGTRRRSAIAHLKAAVQATKADRMLKRERSRQVDAEEQSAYREDLAKVVRPQTSESAEAAAARIVAESRADGAEQSPLVLMSSQRIDPDEGGPGEGQKRAANPPAGDTDDIDDMYHDDYEAFAEFAAEAGANDITDLLEAAAAFTAYVSEQPHFSRPQIMRLAAAATTGESFTREAGLRSFGQLLRQGRIRKLQRGQFAVSGNTRFRPGARIAGE